MGDNIMMETSADCDRVIYTPSDFARDNYLYMQEAGRLTATKAHTSHRDHLDSYLLMVVTAGSGSIHYKGKDISLSAGEFAFIDCTIPYTHTTSKDPWSLSWVHFNGHNMKAIYKKFTELDGKICFKPFSITPLTQTIDELYLLGMSSDHIRDEKLYEKLTTLLTFILDEAGHSDVTQNSEKTNRLKTIRDYLDANYSQKIYLDDLAGQFYMNKYTLIRYFKEQYGVSPVAYLLQLRINKAKQFLRFTEISIEEIAWQCGIQDANYFSRIFHKIEKTTPGEYRKRWATRGESK